MSIDGLAKEVSEYFLGEKQPVPVFSLAKEYVAMAKFGLDWTPATCTEAVEAIRRADQLGLVEIRNGVVYPVATKKVQKDNSQMELF